MVIVGTSSQSALEALTAHTIIERIQVLLAKVQKEQTLSDDGRSALDEAERVTNGLEDYLERMSTPQPDILTEMLQKTNETDWKQLYKDGTIKIPLIKEMSAGGYEAVLLRELAVMKKAKRILEIGVFTSTTTVALALVPTVDKIVALEIEPYLEKFAAPYYKQAGVEKKIDFRVGSALKTLDTLEKDGESFDMVFIDADKDAYYKYYDKLMSSPTLLAEGGVILADNTIYKSSVYAPHVAFKEGADALGKFNQKVRDDPRSAVVLLPVRDGISLIRKL